MGNGADNRRKMSQTLEVPAPSCFAADHPFTVRPHNALQTITGTKVDVLGEPGRTKLVLLKGSVRFSQIEAADHWVSTARLHDCVNWGKEVTMAELQDAFRNHRSRNPTDVVYKMPYNQHDKSQ